MTNNHIHFLSFLIFLSLPLVTSGNAHDPRAINADPLTATSPIAPKLSGLGDHVFPVTSANPESAYFFQQGFRLTLGFNHSEALRSFKESIPSGSRQRHGLLGLGNGVGPEPEFVDATGGGEERVRSDSKGEFIEGQGFRPRKSIYRSRRRAVRR